jgi:hypothetical protein
MTDFTLFQIYDFLCGKNIKVNASMMSKSGLMETVLINGFDMSGIMVNTNLDWTLEMGKYQEFSIRINSPEFVIFEGDKIQFSDGKIYEIDRIFLVNDDYRIFYINEDESLLRDSCRILLREVISDKISVVTGTEFTNAINSLDISFVKSKWIRYVNMFQL